MTGYLSAPFARFFAISLAIHLLFLLLWPGPQRRTNPQDMISFSFLPAPKETAVKPAPPPKKALSKPTAVPKQAPTRPSRAPVIVAKESSPILEEKPPAPKQASTRPSRAPVIVAKESSPISEEKPPQPEAPTPQREAKLDKPRPPEPTREKIPITERSLPTLKELLPPLSWATASKGDNKEDGPVHLDTRNPQYITYFGSIKRAIELVWQYPEPALRYGLQGKLLLEFSILADGKLARARIIRSSGSNLLDQEALRAVQAAAPFSPIPPWIDKSHLDIIASFEYLDSRLNYRYMR